MNEIKEYNETIFESIKHVDEYGNEYWYARELSKVLEYKRWDKFKNVLEKAMVSCENSGNLVLDHFSQVGKMVDIGSCVKRIQKDYRLSRYACYLIVQNADPRKSNIALVQTYFAVQTRRQELTMKEYRLLNKDKKILINYSLNHTAKRVGVKNFDKFHNSGYKGLYNGETANDIAKRKGLRYREDILDNMGSEELAANLFRISQTEQKLKRDNVKTEEDANKIHYEVGRNIRDFIIELGGTLPEELPIPAKNLKELEKETKIKKI